MKQFRAPKELLGDLDAESAAALIATAADVTLVVDRDGVIRDLAFDRDDLTLEHSEHWLGRPWTETVTVESRPKVEALLRDAATQATPRWRQVNHPATGTADVPILYSAVQVGREGRIIALGRDLRAMAALQQRLVEAQQSMERDYARLRHVETRYRLLFQMASEPVLIVDATSQKVLEANPAADGLLGSGGPIQNRAFPVGFDGPGALAIQALLAGVRASGRSTETRARLADGRREVVVFASLLRQEQSSLFLVRLSAPDAAPAAVIPTEKAILLEVMENAPDGIVVSDTGGLILLANGAFLDLAQLATPAQARGESLDRWLGRPGVDLNVLTSNLRQHGSVRLFATTLRGEYGAVAEVEICAVAVPGGQQAAFGFLIRDVGRRLAREPPRDRGLPRSVEQLTELVGRVPLKDLVRETTDVIERLCIEAALDLTGDNRASAAEMLGLSRQSLYVKLRRYGLGDLEPEE